MNPTALLSILLGIFLWASAFVGIRLGVTHFPAGDFVLLRFLLASFILLFTIPLHGVRPKWNKDCLMAMGVGVAAISTYQGFLNYAEVHIDAGVTAFIIGQVPLITTTLAVFVFQEKISLIKVLGLSISFFGTAIIFSHTSSSLAVNQSLIFIVLAGFAGALFPILQKPLLKRMSALAVSFYAIWGGTLGLLIFFPTLYQHKHLITHTTFWTALYLALFPTIIANTLWAWGLHKTSVTHTVSLLYAMPLMTAWMGWVFMAELTPPISLMGGIIAILGAFIIQFAERRATN